MCGFLLVYTESTLGKFEVQRAAPAVLTQASRYSVMLQRLACSGWMAER